MQGVYTFSRTLPKHFTPEKYPATGTVKWTIWEYRKGSNSYRRVQNFYPPSQRDRLGWWTYNTTRIELDGAVKITAEVLESGKRVGIQHVRLNHIDVLPEHLELAKDMCLDANDEMWDRIRAWIGVLGAAAGVIAFSIAALPTAGASLVTAANVARVASAAGVGVSFYDDILTGLGIEQDRRESKLPGAECGDFHATFWYDGYSKFDDDIAELSNSEGAYKSFGCTYLPTRRSPTSNGTAMCMQPEPGN